MYQFLVLTLFFSCATASVVAAADEKNELAYGQSVRTRGSVITLDRGFIPRLAKHPSLETSDRHIWEIVYLINIGDRQAMKLAIELVALDYPEGAKVDDHHRTREIARALSLHEDVFWNLLLGTSLQTRKKVIHFYDVNRADYVGHDYDEEKARILNTN